MRFFSCLILRTSGADLNYAYLLHETGQTEKAAEMEARAKVIPAKYH